MIHIATSLKWKLSLIREGVTLPCTEWRENMITDAGLDAYGISTNWLTFLGACIVGTGAANPIRRDSSPVTFTQSGNTITASASFFVSADAGRLFKWGTGSAGIEVYITGFSSGTVVTVGGSPTTVSTPTIGTIWYVNTASLVTPIAGLTWTKSTANTHSSVAAVSGSVVTVTHTTYNVSSALASAATLTEIAVNINTTNSGVFDRDIISPNVGAAIGDQILVTIQMVSTFTPVTPQAVANVGTGYNSAGNIQIESLGAPSGVGVAWFNSAGNVQNTVGILEGGNPIASANFSLCQAAMTIQPFNSTTLSTVGTATPASSAVQAGYGTGNFYRDTTFTFSISTANGTFFGFRLGSPSSGGGVLAYQLTTSATKANTQTLTYVFRKSWSRVLTN